MALTHWAFVYTAAGTPPEGRFTTEDTGACRTVLVGVPSPDHVLDIAQQLVGDGVQLIELCGGFGPVWAGKVVEAIEHAVPVGTVGYGPEAVDQVHAIFV